MWLVITWLLLDDLRPLACAQSESCQEELWDALSESHSSYKQTKDQLGRWMDGFEHCLTVASNGLEGKKAGSLMADHLLTKLRHWRRNHPDLPSDLASKESQLEEAILTFLHDGNTVRAEAALRRMRK